MSLRLADLAACFEGVIPSIIATAAADGMPNVSYLSHVVRVDDDHVALSNQFFAKTAANVRANPQVMLILVDGLTGAQYQLDIGFVRSVDAGPLFGRIARQLKASSAQVGMAEVMRLRSADIFRVHAIEPVPSPGGMAPPPRAMPDVVALARAAAAIERQVSAEGIIDSLLAGLRQILGCDHALVLVPDAPRGVFVTMGSMGYARSGLGSEVALDEGLIGEAVASGEAIKVSDMSRVRRLGAAMGLEADEAENASRSVAFPALPGAMSQIALPMLSRGVLAGVLFAESPARLAFRDADEAVLQILATQAAGALRAAEREADTDRAAPLASAVRPATGRGIRVVHHRFDESVFVDGLYVIKGVAGLLLRQMLHWHQTEGRDVFTNRELRLALGARMPDIKDNLETRLLLLRRRLEEKGTALRLERAGRGQVRLVLAGPLMLETDRD